MSSSSRCPLLVVYFLQEPTENSLLEVRVEPLNSLGECALFGNLLLLNGQVAPYGEAVVDMREEVELVGNIQFGQDRLTLMALLRSEDEVLGGGGDAEGTLDTSQLLRAHHGWVSRVGDVEPPRAWA